MKVTAFHRPIYNIVNDPVCCSLLNRVALFTGPLCFVNFRGDYPPLIGSGSIRDLRTRCSGVFRDFRIGINDALFIEFVNVTPCLRSLPPIRIFRTNNRTDGSHRVRTCYEIIFRFLTRSIFTERKYVRLRSTIYTIFRYL